MTPIASWGTLSLIEALMAVTNLVGLVLAAVTAAESWMDLEAVVLVGKNGSRRLKAAGNRRDELLKLAVHGLFLLAGIMVMASPAEKLARESFTVEVIEIVVIIVSVALIFGSLRNLIDRRTLWAMPLEHPGPKLREHFDQAEERLKHQSEPAAEVTPEPEHRADPLL